MAIAFNKPMDNALSQRVINVADPSGQPVQGTTVLADQERQWTFAPGNSWQAGSYQLVIQTTIEDLAGNNIGKPFDVDLFEGVQRKLTSSAVKLPFVVR
ncbi:MAG: Ig-like domain-containing protein [Acidobacteriota bacterium]